MAIATIGFVFPQKVTGILEKHLTSKLIEFYREDPDLQNIIDFTQQEVEFYRLGLFRNLMVFFLNLVQVLWSESEWVYGLVTKRVFQLH